MANAHHPLTSSRPSIIRLAKDCTYTLTAANNATDGGNGLPVIISDVTINGNGATITRNSWWSQFRIIEVASEATVSLSDVTVSGGHAADGSAGWPFGNRGPGGDGATAAEYSTLAR